MRRRHARRRESGPGQSLGAITGDRSRRSSEVNATEGSSRHTRPLRAAQRDKVGEESAASKPSRRTLVDAAVHRLLVARSLLLLRWAVGVIFLYFGAL
ncbi:MAG: hypothetical protein ACR2H3_02180, partial [Acidimicrobiales bacterium]